MIFNNLPDNIDHSLRLYLISLEEALNNQKQVVKVLESKVNTLESKLSLNKFRYNNNNKRG